MGYVVPLRDDHELDCELDFEAFYITAQQVKDAANFLNALDDNTLENMYDFQSMKENAVYPLYGNETEADAEFLYEYIDSYLIKLREYFNQTVKKDTLSFCISVRGKHGEGRAFLPGLFFLRRLIFPAAAPARPGRFRWGSASR